MTRRGWIAAALLGALGLAPGATAGSAPTRWRIDEAASSIVFAYELAGRASTGRFTAFAGDGLFDPNHPDATAFALVIDVTSLDLGNPLYSAFALSADWFDAATHPTATYRLAQLAPQTDKAADALGDLTIKGRLAVMTVPVTVEIGVDSARARGSLRFDPGAFGVGQGPSALFVSLGPEVSVSFDLVARPAPAGEAVTEAVP